MSKKKIAILGGGLGGIVAAFWLSDKPGAMDEYDITVYQLGWRLGGKGASGRASPDYGERIEEHGLHIWFGFYENAFHTLSRAFQVLGAHSPPPVATFSSIVDAFTRHSMVTFIEPTPTGWSKWPILFPANESTPGDATGPVSLYDLVVLAVRWLGLMHGDLGDDNKSLLDAAIDRLDDDVVADLAALEKKAKAAAPGLVASPPLAGTRAPSSLVRLHAALSAGEDVFDAIDHGRVARVLGVLRDGAREVLTDRTPGSRLAHLALILDLGFSIAIGIFSDGLLIHGFESVDNEDFREWLKRHGAFQFAYDSQPVRTIYDLVFGYLHGDTNQPNFAAGTCVRGLLRMSFGYRGTLMYEMNAGMGDTIFTPLYGVLAARGVKFEFFNKVESIELDPADATAVGTIKIARQVKLKDGYNPLRRVGMLDCWPDEPLYDQIVDGAKLAGVNLESWWTAWEPVERYSLQRGTDFDVVVLGISLGALPYVAGSLARDPAWQAMLPTWDSGVQTAQTQSAQLWFTRTTAELGWAPPQFAVEAQRSYEQQTGKSLGLTGVGGGYVQPLNTWADLSHLLLREAWPESAHAGSISYLVGPLAETASPPPFSDHAYPGQKYAEVKQRAIDWAGANLAVLLPGATPDLLVDPGNRNGAARFDAQFYRANIDPNERYVLSVKGTTKLRIPGGRSGYSNLVLAGDWTHNRVLNAGCVEAAVSSGMEASQAICGWPTLIVGDSDSTRALG